MTDYAIEVRNIVINFNDNYKHRICKIAGAWEWIEEQIKQLYPNMNLSTSAKIYLVLNKDTEIICKFNNVKKYHSFKLGFTCASTCPCVKERKQNTCNIKYGGKAPASSEIVRNKMVATTLKNLGVRYAMQDKSLLKQAQDTCMKKYGVKHPLQNSEILEKAKKTNLKKYGFEFGLSSENVKEKRKQTLIDKYGIINIGQSHLSNISIEIMGSKEEFLKFIMNYSSAKEASDKLSCSVDYIYAICKKYNINTNFVHSRYEQEISEFLIANNIKYKINDRTIIKPLELDFYIPEFNLAIEIGGLYWHSEKQGKSKFYHNNKMILCKKQNIQLLTIFSDEWDNKKDTIKKHIIHLCNKTTNVIGARKLRLQEIKDSIYFNFLNKYHIQGAVNSAIKIGAYNNEKLIAVIGLKKNKESEYNLVRYATDMNASYPGLMSKFLKYIKNNYIHIDTIITFADLRWSYGNVYYKTGFIEETVIKPDYMYVKNDIRYHKFSFRKAKIAKKFNIDILNKTEKELMIYLQYDRIWDCGKIKFKKIL